MLTVEQVNAAITGEIEYQDDKWGFDKEQSLPGYIVIMQKKIKDALDAWYVDKIDPRGSPLEEILQAVTVGVRCLQTYGVAGSAIATNDNAIDLPISALALTPAATFSADQVSDSRAESAIHAVSHSYTDKVIVLTLPNGSPVYLGKATYLTSYASVGRRTTTIETRSGRLEVRETVQQIQAMLQE